jgi:hypothetical protein
MRGRHLAHEHRAASFQPQLDGLRTPIVHRDPTLAAALSHHRDHARPQVDISDVEAAELGDAKSAPVQELEDSIVPGPKGIVEAGRRDRIIR